MHLPTEIVAFFRSQNPYKDGNNTLWALNKLCNAKKHAALVPVRINQSSVLYTGDTVDFGWVPAGDGWDFNDGEATFLVTKPGVQPKITADVSIDITISEIDSIKNRPASHVLADMSKAVENVLIGTESDCRRLFPQAFT